MTIEEGEQILRHREVWGENETSPLQSQKTAEARSLPERNVMCKGPERKCRLAGSCSYGVDSLDQVN